MPDDVIQFRPMIAADIPVGLELCRIANWNQIERDWKLFLRLGPNDCRVAVKAGQVVGTVTTISYQNIFSWIGMVLVNPAERRQGIGTKLLNEALNVLNDQPLIGLDATPAGREVYLKLGFVDECRLSRMEAVVSGFSQPENGSARQMTEADLPKVFALDRNVFGADRSELLRWLLTGAPESAWVLTRGETVVGFTFGRHGFSFEQLGPVVAENLPAATELVTACLAGQSGKRFVIDAVYHDAEWLRWLESAGFTEQRPFIRMFRGEGRRPGLSEKQFAISGPEFA